ncbi:MAG: hypothetical protein QOI91_2893 [Solirubrobacteraceae bacterium]|nr:hypothetical protein [Solirubrobacteraceae bacterium]
MEANPRGTHVKSQQQRAEERRKEKLDEIEQQVRDGTLVIRQMTEKEKAKNPPKPRQPRRGRGR